MSTEILLEDLTESAVTGNGVFDKLMVTVSAHLHEEFQKGRITGQNYSNVYLGGLNTVMQQSIEFLLRKDLTAKQVDLTAAEVESTKKDTELKTEQIEIAKTQVQLSLKEIELKTAQIAIAQKDLLIKSSQVQLAQKELELKDKELLMAEETLKKTAEEVKLIKKQVVRLDSEIALINAKTNTELGQTSDSINSGIVGAQRRLYEAQTAGLNNDHKYKMTKLNADMFSVIYSQDPDNVVITPPPSWIYSV